MSLNNLIQDPSIKASIVNDLAQLMNEQVAAKGGMGGMALKTAYKVINGIGPQYVQGAIGRLLPEVFNALDPMWQAGSQSGDPVAYLTQNSSQAADAVLSVTDDRMASKGEGVIRSTYNKLRKSVKGDVEAAIPGIAKIIGAHAQAVPQA